MVPITDQLIVVGDRILLKPKTANDKTSSGLYLPPGVHEKEKVYAGYVVKVGPGYPIPVGVDYDEPWKEEEKVKYIPLQAQRGDEALYLHRESYKVSFAGEEYVIVPQSAVLLLVRPDRNVAR